MVTANSNTATKTRQPKPHDVHFATIVHRMRADVDYFPSDNECSVEQLGQWKNHIRDLREAKKLDGLPGFNSSLNSLSTLDSRIDYLLDNIAAAQDQAEQEQDDKRFIKDATGNRVLRLYSIDDIYQTPDPDYLISRILEEATTSLLYGISGTGKTFTALNIALCIAHGEPWHKRRVKQGSVWYINTEGARGLKKRLKAWYAEHPDYQPAPNFKVIPWSLNLREHFPDLLYTIEQEQQKPALIIIDNFSMCTPEVNQKNQEDVAPVLARINTLAQEQECHVMIIHHTTKEGDFNGSMAFRNHVDTMIELRKEDKAAKDSAILFTSQKSRDDELFRDIKTELKVVSLGINQVTQEEITSCVVVESETPIKAAGLKDTAQNVFDLLGSDTLLYSAWKKVAMERLSISKSTFDRARDELTDKGHVKKVRVSVEGKELDHYCRVTEQETTSTESEQVNEQ